MRREHARDESGAAAIELIGVLPIMLVLALCIVDAALMVCTNAEAHWAATAAARELCANPNATDADLLETARAAAPAANVTITRSTGAEQATRYAHHLERGDRQSTATTQQVTVTATASRPTLTVIGSLMYPAGTEGHTATSHVNVSVDRTRGSTW